MPRRQRVFPPGTVERARELRHQGLTYREIIAELGGDIPKNTLSGWVSDIELTTEQKGRIRQIELAGRAVGRERATEWHHEQKRQRLQAAEDWAAPIAERVIQAPEALMLMAAALWLGEGSKKDNTLEFSNSNPQIVKGWLALLRGTFEVDEEKFVCQVLIGAKMSEQECKQFWSELTRIPLNKFHKTAIDQRISKIEREGYKGVCRVTYYSSELRRQIAALGWLVLDKLADKC